MLSLIGIVVLVPTLLYIGLELDVVQRKVSTIAERQLSNLLNADVSIGSVSIAPFNRAWLRDVSVCVGDSHESDTIARIRRLGAGIDIYRLIHGDLVIGYAELIGADLHLKRDSANAPLNIEPIIKALSSQDTLNNKKPYDLQIRTVVLRRINLSYDVCDRPIDSIRFNPDHIQLRDLRADLQIPRISNEETSINLRRLDFSEKSGFSLSDLRFKALISPGLLTITDLDVELPHSRILLNAFSFPLPDKDRSEWSKRVSLHEINSTILRGSYITPSDFSSFVPILDIFQSPVQIEANVDGTINHLNINTVNISYPDNNLTLSLNKCLIDSVTLGYQKMDVDMGYLSVKVSGTQTAELLESDTHLLSEKAVSLIRNAGDVSLLCNATFSQGYLKTGGNLLTTQGAIDFEAAGYPFQQNRNTSTNISVNNLHLGNLLSGVLPKSEMLGNLTMEVSAQGIIRPSLSGKGRIYISELTYNGENLNDIQAEAEKASNGDYSISLFSNDSKAVLSVYLSSAPTDDGARYYTTELDVNALNLSLIGDKASDPRTLSLTASSKINGSGPDDFSGFLRVNNINVSDSKSFTHLDSLSLVLGGTAVPKTISLRSDVLSADISGDYHIKALPQDIKCMIWDLLPALGNNEISKRTDYNVPVNNFDYELTIHSLEKLSSILHLPVLPITPLVIEGSFNSFDRTLEIDIDAPYLRQGNKIIEATHLSATIDGMSRETTSGELFVSSLIPVKSGTTRLDISVHATDNNIESLIGWQINRDKEYSGRLDINTTLHRDTENAKLFADIHFNPSRMVFNDTVWNIEASDIYASHDLITVDNFTARGFDGQHIIADGVVSHEPEDSLHLTLDRIDLDYIFETLEISNAMFGGRATGNFYASALLSSMPRLYTDDLFVKNIKYNQCKMGDAEIRSFWNAEEKAVVINADITGERNNISRIRGMIKPLTEELDFSFHADDVPVGFLKPYMEAFTSDIEGHASGDARLYGTFKLLDMTGDIFARAFRMKVDFTNCWYQTTDSIHLRPGRIDIPGVTLYDVEGHTAVFSGLVTHKCFKEPEFYFNITDARDLLVYDVGQRHDQNWFGKIYGNGGAHVVGVPGRIDIDVNMSTAPGSSFTFVLSDAEQAYDYTFINFRDRNGSGEEIIDISTPMEVRELQRQLHNNTETSSPSVYELEIAMDVNPNTAVTLVMDPVGGDRIRARGGGNLNMKYNSIDEELDIRGAYTLSEGNYNFTLQDIIIKDFTISSGSKIEFFGNPYNARLDMEAVYQLNANLTDLDESFQQDKEISRTNVPIQALLMVQGEISQPEIKFDLRFPTLTDDTYRKVKSIISTDDMMNRQIIYLLALNRFYTPEYMSGTKGNELVSVASSTISSQLSNLLGQLSDNWSIAPNFRSDRGDFSDVEFDVALSSRLLNNRLMLNGNFGYRDKTMNNNSFIGDFDIEYLLNRSGSLRLKAYNRYNDRNFYIKSALTTQGVGLMYRRNFDDIKGLFPFLRNLKRSNEESPSVVPADSTKVLIGKPMIEPTGNTQQNISL